ncbi:MAG: metallophosphoesterase [Betaproteobacteria bacterium]
MKTLIYRLWLCSLALLVIPSGILAQEQQADRGHPSRSGDTRPTGGPGPRQPVPVVPATGSADVILGCPTTSSIVLSVMRYDHDGKVIVSYGLREHDPTDNTATLALKKDQPQAITLDKLEPARRYTYQLKDVESGKILVIGDFRTSRQVGDRFVFTLTADSHLDLNTNTTLYQRTLANAKADSPDFHIDMGDTFMTGKHESRENAAQQYRSQRIYFAQAAQSMPLYLVLGNHDGEESRFLRDGADGLAVWSNAMRKRYFPNPVPDNFYSGNTQPDPWAGQLQDYYTWTWGEALFIVLNPYWHGSSRRGDERWELSLGNSQYQWLKQALATSKARYKFVFVHQLIGGRDRQGRGGVEATGFGEWGGLNADGTDGFKAHRPGWDMPIHKLLVRHGVSAVFHGHDHLYAMQELDGIVYQEVPQPGHSGQGVPRFATEYGYLSGTILGGAGHLRVTVASDKTTVDFVRAQTDHQGNAANDNRKVAHSYIIPVTR